MQIRVDRSRYVHCETMGSVSLRYDCGCSFFHDQILGRAATGPRWVYMKRDCPLTSLFSLKTDSEYCNLIFLMAFVEENDTVAFAVLLYAYIIAKEEEDERPDQQQQQPARVRRTMVRQFWVRPWLTKERRQHLGQFSSLLDSHLRLENPVTFQNYTRLTPKLFDEVLQKVAHVFPPTPLTWTVTGSDIKVSCIPRFKLLSRSAHFYSLCCPEFFFSSDVFKL